MTDNEEKATQQASVTPPEQRNPTGKGGFGDNPQNRNPGGWRKEMVFSYQYRRFMNMTINEMETWNSETPKKVRTVVEDLAFRRVKAARESLPDVKEISDRTEGKAHQSIDMTSGGDSLFNNTKLIIEVVDATATPESESETEPSASDTQRPASS